MHTSNATRLVTVPAANNLPAEYTGLPEPRENPAEIGFPPMLPIELALAESPVREICADYKIDKEAFTKLCSQPAFIKAVRDAQEMLAKEGMGFRMKARMQAEALLDTSWALIHAAHTNSAVKADLIKQTWKVAGFEPKAEDRSPVMPLQINIQL